jgi:hypothetical protein
MRSRKLDFTAKQMGQIIRCYGSMDQYKSGHKKTGGACVSKRDSHIRHKNRLLGLEPELNYQPVEVALFNAGL